MQRIDSAVPARYENGFIVSVGDPATSEDVQWIEESGYDVVETNIRGWGEYNAIISVGYGREAATYLAIISEQAITRVDMVIPNRLKRMLADTANQDGVSESEVVSQALADYLVGGNGRAIHQ